MHRLVLLNALLLATMALAIGGIQVFDHDSGRVDALVRRYALAVTAGDLDGALEEIDPAARDRWREWIAAVALGSVYEVRSVSVRSPSFLAQIVRGERATPREATVVLDVDRPFPARYYQPASRVPLGQANGRWYLEAPLLAPPE